MFNKIDNRAVKSSVRQQESGTYGASQHKKAKRPRPKARDAVKQCNMTNKTQLAFKTSNKRRLWCQRHGKAAVFDVDRATILFFRHFFGLGRG